MVEEKIIEIKGVKYIVSSDGHVYSTNTGGPSYYHKEISQRLNKDGYLQVTVGLDGHRTQYRVHRMVAEAFIPNPDNLPDVNHKDYDRTNNNVDNLEWCTHDDNISHSAGTGHYSHFGEDNPNYGCDTLKRKYAENPELAKINNSRPGGQNGRSRAVRIIDSETKEELVFDYMRKAAQYLIKNGFTRAVDIDAVMNRVSMAAKTGVTIYKKFKVKFIN